jgi:hypothetical protein
MSSLNSRHKVFYGSTAQQASTMDAINTSGGLVPPSQRVHNSKQVNRVCLTFAAEIAHWFLKAGHDKLWSFGGPRGVCTCRAS